LPINKKNKEGFTRTHSGIYRFVLAVSDRKEYC